MVFISLTVMQMITVHLFITMGDSCFGHVVILIGMIYENMSRNYMSITTYSTRVKQLATMSMNLNPQKGANQLALLQLHNQYQLAQNY
jgi:hypothetical protein